MNNYEKRQEKEALLTRDEFAEFLNYDPMSGHFRWRKKSGRRCVIGGLAGCANTQGYWVIRLWGDLWLAHRLAHLLMTGAWPDDQIDHIDHNRTNNKWSNLRAVGHKENGRNVSRHTRNKTGITGVSWNCARSRWYAEIGAGNVRIRLGSSKSLLDAAALRKSAELRYGYHPNHGR